MTASSSVPCGDDTVGGCLPPMPLPRTYQDKLAMFATLITQGSYCGGRECPKRLVVVTGDVGMTVLLRERGISSQAVFP